MPLVIQPTHELTHLGCIANAYRRYRSGATFPGSGDARIEVDQATLRIPTHGHALWALPKPFRLLFIVFEQYKRRTILPLANGFDTRATRHF